jgi:polar amino acid transport system permease protein
MSQWPDYLPDLLQGLLVSLKLTGASLALGLPLGLLLGVMVMNHRRAVRAAGLVVVELGRGAPALVLLYLVYFGLAQQRLSLSAFLAAVLAIGWSAGAYASEIFRSSLEAVPSGQHEASAAVGLTPLQSFRSIVLPQAIRIAIPPLMGLAIMVFQTSALAFAIGIPEIMSRAYELGSQTFAYLSLLTLASVIYASVALPASAAVRLLEKRLARHV